MRQIPVCRHEPLDLTIQREQARFLEARRRRMNRADGFSTRSWECAHCQWLRMASGK